MGHSYQTYALRGTEIVYIDDVERGMKCECTCPGCGERLIARKGQKRIHHFAHQSDSCEYGYETSLHLAAKDILSSAKTLTLPPTYSLFPHTLSGDDPSLEARRIHIDHVELERRFGSVVPDIVIYSNGKQLFVEIFVTHKIDEEKREKIKALEISTIEIDLSATERTITREALSSLLLYDCPEKKWVYNAWADTLLKELLSYTEEKPITHRGATLHADYCPLHVRDSHGKPYANVNDDCIGCKFFFGENAGVILCSGDSLISTPQDLKLTFEERKNKYKNALAQCDLIAASSFDQDSITEENIDQELDRTVSYQIPKIDKQAIKMEDFNKQKPVMDNEGWRWMLCTNCRSILRVDSMYSRGARGNINKGICLKCHYTKGSSVH